jgi:hypothetical protein
LKLAVMEGICCLLLCFLEYLLLDVWTPTFSFGQIILGRVFSFCVNERILR